MPPRPYQELVDYVRRFSVGLTLIELARRNADIAQKEMSPRKSERVSVQSTRVFAHELPFVLGGIARTALVSGAKHRSRPPRPRDVAAMASIHVDIESLDLGRIEEGSSATLSRVLARYTYEQFGAQESVFANLARTTSLLLDHADRYDKFPSAEQWTAELGCTLEHFIRIGLALHLRAITSGGLFTRDDLRKSEWEPVWAPVGAEVTLRVIERWFLTTIDEARKEGVLQEIPSFEKWSFNPLVGRPLVDLDGKLCAPWPWLTLQKVSPTGLYHVGIELFGRDFPGALGHVFEAYVGSQLELLGVEVVSEVTFRDGKDLKKTVDFFLVFPELVLLVEVKSARPTADGRAGATDDGEQDIARKINKAYDQIKNSSDMLDRHHPALRDIPKDRPRAAIVVTLETFTIVNTDLADGYLTRPPIPTAVVSSHELEQVVSTLAGHSDAGSRILSALTPGAGGTPALDRAIAGLEVAPNVILEDAWDRIYEPWTQARSRLRSNPAGD